MNASQTHTMFNPYDGAIFATAGLGSFFLGLITGNSPVVAAVASALVMGIFALAAKAMQIWWESRKDRRIARLKERAERAEQDVVKLLEQNQNLIARR